jgi:hypothetical protein
MTGVLMVLAVISDRKKLSTYPAAACKEVESQVLFGARAVAGRFWVARSIYLQVAVDCRLDQTYTNASRTSFRRTSRRILVLTEEP